MSESSYNINVTAQDKTAAGFASAEKSTRELQKKMAAMRREEERAEKAGTIGALKSQFGEDSRLGQTLKMFQGAGAVAGVTMLGRGLHAASEKAVEIRDALDRGVTPTRDMADEWAKTLPVLGSFYGLLRDGEELITGELAARKRAREELEQTVKVAQTLAALEKSGEAARERQVDQYKRLRLEFEMIGQTGLGKALTGAQGGLAFGIQGLRRDADATIQSSAAQAKVDVEFPTADGKGFEKRSMFAAQAQQELAERLARLRNREAAEQTTVNDTTARLNAPGQSRKVGDVYDRSQAEGNLETIRRDITSTQRQLEEAQSVADKFIKDASAITAGRDRNITQTSINFAATSLGEIGTSLREAFEKAVDEEVEKTRKAKTLIGETSPVGRRIRVGNNFEMSPVGGPKRVGNFGLSEFNQFDTISGGGTSSGGGGFGGGTGASSKQLDQVIGLLETLVKQTADPLRLVVADLAGSGTPGY